MSSQETLISLNDAQALSRVVANLERSLVGDESLAELSAKLSEARIVQTDALPADTIRFRSTVSYEELPGGTRRRVTLVGPRDADASAGRISVLSPMGRALLGRSEGEVVDVPVPMGRRISVRVAEVARRALDELEEECFA
jgi:transcription elongation GreA/GreB family factor